MATSAKFRHLAFFSCSSLRFSTSSHLSNKIKNANERALKYHQNYYRKMNEKGNFRPLELLTETQKYKNYFHVPQVKERRNGIEDAESDESRVESAINAEFGKVLKFVEFEQFGNIHIHNNDILEVPSDLLIVPITINHMPYRGVALTVLEVGGKKLYTRMQEAIRIWRDETNEAIGTRRNVSNKSHKSSPDSGTILFVASGDIFPSFPFLGFLFLPYYWSSPPLLANSSLRRAIRCGFSSLQSFKSISVPLLGNGAFGHNDVDCCRIIVDECTDLLLQVNADYPAYNLNTIHICDYNSKIAEILAEQLGDIERLRIPEKQVVPSTSYWNHATERLLTVPPKVIKWSKKYNRISFKKHHNIPRHRLMHWRMNVRPFIWRTSRVLEPPSLLVYKSTGLPAEKQPEPKPFYYRGVSHQLFPPLRAGFPAMRLDSNGKFVGTNRHPKIDREIKPRN